nr:MAG TPA_asm: hypothetical protein [Caudoviricetes sp.]DAQ36647.1 MAG TPA: hypothetical protein [Caudoviricetes sp.]
MLLICKTSLPMAAYRHLHCQIKNSQRLRALTVILLLLA